MMLSKAFITEANIKVIALYMPGLSPHLPDMEFSRINKEVLEMDGRTNASFRFLRPGCTDTMCTSTNTRVCKGVLKIPRTPDLPQDILRGLDSLCYPGEAIDATTIEIATSGEFSENGSLEQILHGAITDIDLEMHSMPSNVDSQSVEWTSQLDQTGDPLSQLQTGNTPPPPLPSQTGTPPPPTDQLPSPSQTASPPPTNQLPSSSQTAFPPQLPSSSQTAFPPQLPSSSQTGTLPISEQPSSPSQTSSQHCQTL